MLYYMLVLIIYLKIKSYLYFMDQFKPMFEKIRKRV